MSRSISSTSASLSVVERERRADGSRSGSSSRPRAPRPRRWRASGSRCPRRPRAPRRRARPGRTRRAPTRPSRAQSPLAAGSKTHWVRPSRSRRSMKMRPPWSRRRKAQPISVTVRPTSSDPQRAAAVRPLPARRAPQCSSGDASVRPTGIELDREASRCGTVRCSPVFMSRRMHWSCSSSVSPTITAYADAETVGVLQLTSAACAHRSRAPRTRPAGAARERPASGDRSAASPSGISSASGRRRRARPRRGAAPRAPSPIAKPIPGVGGPSELLDEPVVATAARHRVLRAEVAGQHLEGRADVVVEPADEARIDDVARSPMRVETARARCLEVLAGLGRQRVEDRGRLLDDRLAVRRLAVEHAQRVPRQARLALVAQPILERRQVLEQPRDVRRPRARRRRWS